jgi:release factor glutamine methyltransferase
VLLEQLTRRRLTGEPLAWITGVTEFCGLQILVDPGVYVPRPHTEQIAERAAELLPDDGIAIDLCTGSGAVAAVLQARRPAARVVATDVDEASVACARRNGVEAYTGDLFDALPRALPRSADVVVAVPPYVPTPELSLLQRDTFTFESSRSYDGGADGADVVRRILAESWRFLRAGGSVLVELGGGVPDVLEPKLERLGYTRVRLITDEDGDVRGLEVSAPR